MKRKNAFISFTRVCAAVTSIVNNLSRQRSFLKNNIIPVLRTSAKQNDGSLDQNDFKKITGYYGLAVPAVLGEAFCCLHNKKMTVVERKASTAQGAMTGLFDDFFDKESLSDSSIAAMLGEKEMPGNKSNEKLFHHFYREALQTVPVKKRMLDCLMNVYEAQLKSKKQVGAFLSEKEIKDITYNKGGTSLLFYRAAFLPVPSAEEEKLLYNLGGLMQLSNDIFDVYKDRENDIQTLVTMATHMEPVRQLLKQQLAINYTYAYNIEFPKKNVTGFLSKLSLGIFSRAFVCLDQLEKNEAATNNTFDVGKYVRKQLICDMAKLKNIVRSGVYYSQLCE